MVVWLGITEALLFCFFACWGCFRSLLLVMSLSTLLLSSGVTTFSAAAAFLFARDAAELFLQQLLQVEAMTSLPFILRVPNSVTSLTSWHVGQCLCVWEPATRRTRSSRFEVRFAAPAALSAGVKIPFLCAICLLLFFVPPVFPSCDIVLEYFSGPSSASSRAWFACPPRRASRLMFHCLPVQFKAAVLMSDSFADSGSVGGNRCCLQSLMVMPAKSTITDATSANQKLFSQGSVWCLVHLIHLKG